MTMTLRVAEVRDDDAYEPQDSLFDDVRRFRFTPARGGFLRTRSIPLGDIRVAEVSSAGHDISIGAVGDMTFLAPQTGRIGVQTPRNRAEARAGGALLVGPGDRETFVRAEPARAFRAFVAIAPIHREALQRSVCRAPGSAPARSLAGFLDYFFDEAGRPASPLLRPASLTAASALIRDGLLAALDGVGPPDEAREAAARHVRAAEEYIRAHADWPLTVEAIARAVGIGPRALQAAFRDRLETTPRALLEAVRMERARARLLAPMPNTTVTDAALDSGFVHLGRFAAAYRRRYGESPSETLRKAR